MKQTWILLVIIISSFFFILEAQASDYDNEFNILNSFELKEHHFLVPELSNANNLVCKFINNNIYIYSLQRRITIKNKLQTIYKNEDNVFKKILFISPENDWLLDFYISNDRLYILGNDNLYIFDLIDNGTNDDITTFYIKSIKTKKEFRKIKVENNQIILSESCFGCTKKGMRVLILSENDRDNKIIDYHEFETPLGFQLDFYQPSLWLDACNGYYLKSEILDYHIVIYNNKFDSINCISRNLPAFEYNNRHLFEDTTSFNNLYNPANQTFKFDSLERVTSKIQLVNFLNDTTIIVCYYYNSDIFSDIINRYYYDIWSYNSTSGQWELCKSELMNLYSYWDNDFVNLKYLIIGMFYDYQISNGKIFKFYQMPFSLNDIDTTKVTYKQLYDMKTDFMNKNGIRLTLLVYEFKP